MQSYIYTLTDPHTGAIRYVGKTDHPKRRAARHMNASELVRVNHRTNWLRGLKDLGLVPVFDIVEVCDRAVWKERECWWIAYCRSLGAELVNTAEGGSGGVKPEWISAETKQKMREAQLGKVRDRDAIEHMAATRRGVPRSEETKRKVSEGNKGKGHGPEWRAAHAAALRGRKFSEETKAKMSVKGLGNTKAKRHDYVAIDPTGVEHAVARLTEFCKLKGLDASRMRRLAAGDPLRSTHKGWLCKYL